MNKILYAFMTIIIIGNSISAYELNTHSYGTYRIYCDIREEKYISYNNRVQSNFDYYYFDESNEKRAAYCLDLGIDGAESMDEFYVDANEKIDNKVLNSMVLKGYPYKTYQELGVANEIEAKYVTQFCIWSYLSKLDILKIKPLTNEYLRISNAIQNLYNNVLNEPDLSEEGIINITKNDFTVDNVDKNYYSAKINLDYNSNIRNVSFNILGDFNNYIFTDDLNNKYDNINNINNIKNFKILVPRDKIIKDSNIKIEIKYDLRQIAVLFGKSKIPGMQNVGITQKPIISKSIYEELNIKNTKENLTIIKVDKEDKNVKIENVKFRIYNENDMEIGEFTTDNNGEIQIDLVKYIIKNKDTIIIEEIEVPNYYYLDKNNNKKSVIIEYGIENKVYFENEKIRGNIKIVKVSNQNNNINNLPKGSYLKDAIFEIYDENMKLIETIKTDDKGIAISSMFLKGKYFIKEKIAPKDYIIDNKIYEANITKYKELIEIKIGNDSVNKIELPKTGC